MGQKYAKYSREFRESALRRLALAPNVAQLCRELGISRQLLPGQPRRILPFSPTPLPQRGRDGSAQRHPTDRARALPTLWVPARGGRAPPPRHGGQNEHDFSPNGELSNCKLSHGKGSPQHASSPRIRFQLVTCCIKKIYIIQLLCVLFPHIAYTRIVSGVRPRAA